MSKEIFYLKRGFDELGISAKTIEKDLEVSQSFVSNILNGKKAIGGSIAVRLHELYNLDLYWLLTGKGNKTDNNKKVINQNNSETRNFNESNTEETHLTDSEKISHLLDIVNKNNEEMKEVKFKLKVLTSISNKAFELLFENFDMDTFDVSAIEKEVRSELNSEL